MYASSAATQCFAMDLTHTAALMWKDIITSSDTPHSTDSRAIRSQLTIASVAQSGWILIPSLCVSPHHSEMEREEGREMLFVKSSALGTETSLTSDSVLLHSIQVLTGGWAQMLNSHNWHTSSEGKFWEAVFGPFLAPFILQGMTGGQLLQCGRAGAAVSSCKQFFFFFFNFGKCNVLLFFFVLLLLFNAFHLSFIINFICFLIFSCSCSSALIPPLMVFETHNLKHSFQLEWKQKRAHQGQTISAAHRENANQSFDMNEISQSSCGKYLLISNHCVSLSDTVKDTEL